MYARIVANSIITPTEQIILLLTHGLDDTLGIEKSVIKIPIIDTHKPKKL